MEQDLKRLLPDLERDPDLLLLELEVEVVSLESPFRPLEDVSDEVESLFDRSLSEPSFLLLEELSLESPFSLLESDLVEVDLLLDWSLSELEQLGSFSRTTITLRHSHSHVLLLKVCSLLHLRPVALGHSHLQVSGFSLSGFWQCLAALSEQTHLHMELLKFCDRGHFMTLGQRDGGSVLGEETSSVVGGRYVIDGAVSVIV